MEKTSSRQGSVCNHNQHLNKLPNRIQCDDIPFYCWGCFLIKKFSCLEMTRKDLHFILRYGGCNNWCSYLWKLYFWTSLESILIRTEKYADNLNCLEDNALRININLHFLFLTKIWYKTWSYLPRAMWDFYRFSGMIPLLSIRFHFTSCRRPSAVALIIWLDKRTFYLYI